MFVRGDALRSAAGTSSGGLRGFDLRENSFLKPSSGVASQVYERFMAGSRQVYGPGRGSLQVNLLCRVSAKSIVLHRYLARILTSETTRYKILVLI